MMGWMLYLLDLIMIESVLLLIVELFPLNRNRLAEIDRYTLPVYENNKIMNATVFRCPTIMVN